MISIFLIFSASFQVGITSMLSFEKDQKYTCVYIHNRIWELEKQRMGIRNKKCILRATFSPFLGLLAILSSTFF